MSNWCLIGIQLWTCFLGKISETCLWVKSQKKTKNLFLWLGIEKRLRGVGVWGEGGPKHEGFAIFNRILSWCFLMVPMMSSSLYTILELKITLCQKNDILIDKSEGRHETKKHLSMRQKLASSWAIDLRWSFAATFRSRCPSHILTQWLSNRSCDTFSASCRTLLFSSSSCTPKTKRLVELSVFNLVFDRQLQTSAYHIIFIMRYPWWSIRGRMTSP